MGNCSGCISFFRFLAIHFRRLHDTDDSLTAGIDVDVLDRDLLLAFAAVPIERIEQEGIGTAELVRLAQVLSARLERFFLQFCALSHAVAPTRSTPQPNCLCTRHA